MENCSDLPLYANCVQWNAKWLTGATSVLHFKSSETNLYEANKFPYSHVSRKAVLDAFHGRRRLTKCLLNSSVSPTASGDSKCLQHFPGLSWNSEGELGSWLHGRNNCRNSSKRLPSPALGSRAPALIEKIGKQKLQPAGNFSKKYLNTRLTRNPSLWRWIRKRNLLRRE